MSGRRRNISLFVLLLMILFSTLPGCTSEKEPEKEIEISVSTDAAKEGEIARTERYSGIVRGKNEVYIMPAIPARVTEILVKPGERVSRDQVLLRLDSSDLDVAVQQARANLAAAQAQQSSNEISLQNARVNYERIKELHEAGGVSDKDLEAAKMQYDLLSSGTIEAGVAQAQAAMENLQKQIDNCNLKSPINGMVGSINLSLGEIANPQSPAAIVTDISEVEIKVLVSESEVDCISAGSDVEVYIKAAGEAAFQAKVESVSAAADPVKRNYSVKVALANKDNKVKSGMFAEVHLATEKKENALYIPRNAVVPRGERNVVYVVDEDNRAREREVLTGIESRQIIEILEGLESGEEIITRGNTLVNEGTLVRVIAGGDK